MTCKDCLHYEACENKFLPEEPCKMFSGKSEWVHLPCKAGDNVYCFEPSFNQMRKAELKVLKTKIIDVKTTMTVYGLNFNLDDVGKTVFLTREEAEKALAERSRK